jgi:hypothetical protein
MKSCITCVHWDFYGGDQACCEEHGSDSPASVRCIKKHYEGKNKIYVIDISSAQGFRRVFSDKAKQCKDYEKVTNG